MQISRLAVHCVEARGLAETGVFDNMDPFIGCYIVPSDKHRTRNHKDGGSEPQWNETLYVDVPAGENTLYVEVFDEDPRSASIIGEVTIELSEITISDQLEKRFPIRRINGNQVGEVHLVLNMEGSIRSLGYPPPPPDFENQQYQTEPPQYNRPNTGYPQEENPSYGLPPAYDGPSTRPDEKQYNNLGPQVPMPLNYGSGNPPPFSPPPPQQYNAPGFPLQWSDSPYSYGGQAESQASSTVYQSPESQTSTGKQPGEPVPDWMKMGGAALAGAAAVGLGTWIVGEVKEHNEHIHKQQQQQHHDKKHHQYQGNRH
ncbi:C2 domain-containing protein [Umbelopsis sp. PMI_123]|nr:C2 domain-containing protein [Umbelopsis sp. PMI_123]